MSFPYVNSTPDAFNNNLMYVNNVTSFDRQFLHWSFIVLEVAAIVVIVVGDISMLMLFFTRKLLGQSTNILVFSVAIGDLVNGVLTFPLAMLQKIMQEPSEFMCKGYFYFANVSKTAVGYTILLLAMERIAAVLNCTYRILPPGRCLFFASLTWFFSAAYNIWSVVIYGMETVKIPLDITDQQVAAVKGFSICFASTRFMYLHEIFEYLNPLVTFAFPAITSNLIFLGFWLKKDEIVGKPGRPYKSSKSVVIFTFALLVSFIATHLPWELANLIFIHDAFYHTTRELMVLKILHIITFSRGFWDIFIFGAFRRYVCKKEKALAHFREQRSLQVHRSSLSIPVNNDRPASLSLLDSDPSVSRRYSSDNTISRRPSAMDGVSVCSGEMHQVGNDDVTTKSTADHTTSLNNAPSRRKSTTITTTIITDNYLIPRSPCLHDHSRRFSFAPPSFSAKDRVSITEQRNHLKRVKTNEVSISESKTSPNASIGSDVSDVTASATSRDNLLDHSTNSSSSLQLINPSQLTVTSLKSSTTPAIFHSISPSVSTPAPILHLSHSHSNSSQFLQVDKQNQHRHNSKTTLTPPGLFDQSALRIHCEKTDEKKRTRRRKSTSNIQSSRRSSPKKHSLFLETSFDLTATSPTTIAIPMNTEIV